MISLFTILKGDFWVNIAVAAIIGLLGLIISLCGALIYRLRHDNFKAKIRQYRDAVGTFCANNDFFKSLKARELHSRLAETIKQNVDNVPISKKEPQDSEKIKEALSNIGKIRSEALDLIVSDKSILNNIPADAMTDEISAVKKEAEELKSILKKSVRVIYLFLRANNLYKQECNNIENAIGEYENKTNVSGEEYVSIIKSHKSGDMLFLLNNKGLISVVRGMNKSSEPFNIKSDGYTFLASEPMKNYVIDYLSMGQDNATKLAIIMGEDDEVIKSVNEEIEKEAKKK